MNKLLIFLLSLCVTSLEAATITNWGAQLPTAVPASGDVILMQKGGVTYYFTPNQLATQLSTNANLTVVGGSDSNALYSIIIANGATTSNGLFSVDTTRNGAVSNGVVTLVMVTSNTLYTGAGSNVTNVVSLSMSNATSKPITNSYTAGVVTLFGVEAGTNVTITPNGSNLVISATGDGSTSDLAMTIIASRTYQRETNVTASTISNVIANITTANFTNRWLVRVPNGLYPQEAIDLTGKSFIDIVGHSRTGVVISSSSTNSDTFKIGGAAVMLANMTILHTNDASDVATFYPIHMDTGNNGSNLVANHYLVSLTCQTYGTGGKSGLGVGHRENQRLLAVDCSFISSSTVGLNLHNTPNSSIPVRMDFVNCIATGAGTGFNGYGLSYANLGSTKPDILNIIGGVYSGTGGGIVYTNTAAGANETILFTSGDVIGSVVMTDTSRRSFAQLAPLDISAPTKDFTGTLNTGPSGWTIGQNGDIRPNLTGGHLALKPDGGSYFQENGSDVLIYHMAGYNRFTVGLYGMTLYEDVASGLYGGLYARVNNVLDIGAPVLRFKDGWFAGTIDTTNQIVQKSLSIMATNTLAAPASTSFAGSFGAHLWSDGTNLCVVLQNGAGTRTTNKLSMTAWP